MKKLLGKRALITGGSAGIGLAAAKLFAAEGANVIITGREQTKLDLAKNSLPDSAITVVNDAEKIAEIPRLIQQIDSIGALDAVVFNAGLVQAGSLLEITSEQFDRAINTNAKSVFFTIQELIRKNLMVKGGTIVAVTGIICKGGREGFGVYGGSKALLANFTKSLGLELIQFGIRFNSVCPGATNTDIFKNMGLAEEVMSEIRRDIADKTPIKRFATPEEVAKTILFLSCDDSSYMVGSELIIDGGTSLRI